MKPLFALLTLGVATPVMAQHAGHTVPTPMPMPMPAPTSTPTPEPAPAPAKPAVDPAPTQEAMDHSAMDHGAMEQVDATSADPAMPMDDGEKDMSAMDHSQMDMGEMDHSQMDMDTMTMPIPEAPPPAAAGSGPPRAADVIWGAEAMHEAREALRREQGGQTFFGVFGDRFEYRAREDKDGYLWDVDAWYGGDINRVWIESEGEGAFGEDVEAADVSLLYGRAIGPWFDLQAGVRQDLTGPTRTYLDLGIQGLAPYRFEMEADVFVSNKGDITARAELELDQRITQRLILQPRGEISLAAQDVPELGIGAGIGTIEAGLRLRYEFAREFAPYVGVEQEWKLGDSADFARAAGEDPNVTNYVVGIRFWF
ncbi:copper resistance protein B [Sphingopyxis chilensis]